MNNYLDEISFPENEGVNYQDLTRGFGSPLYVYDVEKIREFYNSLTRSISYRHSNIYFAIVTNSNPEIIRQFYNLGTGIHASSVGDAWIAISCGIPSADIVITSSNLTNEDLDFVIEHNLKINLDSLYQLENYLKKDPTQNPGIRLYHPCMGDSRIGITEDEIPTAQQLCLKHNMELAGVHFYRGTGSLNSESFIRPFDDIYRMAASIPTLRYIDIGGGFGFDYKTGNWDGVDWTELGNYLDQKTSKLSEKLGRQISCYLEPGRCMIAGAGVLLTTVVDVKKRDNKYYIGTDSSVSNISVINVHGKQRRVEAYPKASDSTGETWLCDICGSSTYSKDYLAKNVEIPPIEPGDLIAILDCGAYGYSMSSNFLSIVRPAEVLISDDHEKKLIRQREHYRDLLSHSRGERTSHET